MFKLKKKPNPHLFILICRKNEWNKINKYFKVEMFSKLKIIKHNRKNAEKHFN